MFSIKFPILFNLFDEISNFNFNSLASGPGIWIEVFRLGGAGGGSYLRGMSPKRRFVHVLYRQIVEIFVTGSELMDFFFSLSELYQIVRGCVQTIFLFILLQFYDLVFVCLVCLC